MTDHVPNESPASRRPKSNLFVLYDADSAQNKRQPKAKGIKSFAQYQSVKQRKAAALKRLRPDRTGVHAIRLRQGDGCTSTLPSPQHGTKNTNNDPGPLHHRRAREALVSTVPLTRLTTGGGRSMDPFNSGVVKIDPVMAWVQQHCESPSNNASLAELISSKRPARSMALYLALRAEADPVLTNL